MHSDGAADLRTHVLDNPRCEIINLGAVIQASKYFWDAARRRPNSRP